MKTIALALALVATLALGGCFSKKSVLQGGTSITTTIPNPVAKKELAAIQASYGVTLTAAVAYRRYCYSAAREALPSVCRDRRAIVLKLQAADRKARAAIVAAKNFVRDNPTLSGLSVIGAARAAVADFKSVAATNGVQ